MDGLGLDSRLFPVSQRPVLVRVEIRYLLVVYVEIGLHRSITNSSCVPLWGVRQTRKTASEITAAAMEELVLPYASTVSIRSWAKVLPPNRFP